MRRRLLNKMQTEQMEQSRSQEVKARLVPPVILSIVNEGAAFQGVAQSSPAGSVPPAQSAPFKRGPGRPRKNPL